MVPARSFISHRRRCSRGYLSTRIFMAYLRLWTVWPRRYQRRQGKWLYVHIVSQVNPRLQEIQAIILSWPRLLWLLVRLSVHARSIYPTDVSIVSSQVIVPDLFDCIWLMYVDRRVTRPQLWISPFSRAIAQEKVCLFPHRYGCMYLYAPIHTRLYSLLYVPVLCMFKYWTWSTVQYLH